MSLSCRLLPAPCHSPEVALGSHGRILIPQLSFPKQDPAGHSRPCPTVLYKHPSLQLLCQESDPGFSHGPSSRLFSPPGMEMAPPFITSSLSLTLNVWPKTVLRSMCLIPAKPHLASLAPPWPVLAICASGFMF